MLESEYQKGRQDIEKMKHKTKLKPPKDVKQEEKKELDSIEGMDYFDCNSCICDEIENVLAEDDEDLSKATKEITHTFLNIDLKSNWFMNTYNLNQSDFMRFKRRTLDSLYKYQQRTMMLKVLHVRLKHKDEVL